MPLGVGLHHVGTWMTPHFPRTRKARARGYEGPSFAAPPTSTAPTSIPSTLVPTTPGPSAQSTYLIVPMLHSIHQGLYLVLQRLQNPAQHQPILSIEEFSLQVAWPRVQPSSHGGGEASVVYKPQPDPETTPAAQEDDSEATPLEPFMPEANLSQIWGSLLGDSF